MQFGFRPGLGTEIALLTVLDELRMRADRGQSAILILLDLSAAFNTVNHKIILVRLKEIGVEGMALKWFQSYLSNKQQAVTLPPYQSKFDNIQYGVPQGSAISPILFNIYMSPLISIIKS